MFWRCVQLTARWSGGKIQWNQEKPVANVEHQSDTLLTRMSVTDDFNGDFALSFDFCETLNRISFRRPLKWCDARQAENCTVTKAKGTEKCKEEIWWNVNGLIFHRIYGPIRHYYDVINSGHFDTSFFIKWTLSFYHETWCSACNWVFWSCYHDKMMLWPNAI